MNEQTSIKEEIESLRKQNHMLRGRVDNLHSDIYMRTQDDRERIDKLEDFRGYTYLAALVVAVITLAALVHFAVIGIKASLGM